VDYRLDERSLRADMERIDRLRWLFGNLGLDPRYEDWFRHRAWVRTLHGTTRIEGNSLNDVEVEQLLERRAPARQKDALEVVASREALAFVDIIATRRGLRIDEHVIREIHRRVLDAIDPMLRPGEYRRGENRVADAEGNLLFSTPISGDVPDLMHRFGGWLRGRADGHPPTVVAALAHLELVAIHPFYDGNGRTARALSRLLLVRGGYALSGLVSLDAYLDLQRREYFAAIRSSLGRTYAPGYDATRFVCYFLAAIAGAAEHVLSRIKGVAEVLRALGQATAAGTIGAPVVDGLVYTWINGSIRPADYRAISRRTGPSATRDLARAVAAGYLVATGETRVRRYVAGPKLQAVRPVPVTDLTSPRSPRRAPAPRAARSRSRRGTRRSRR
jgi:Fic family protein